ncbi:hypothetical protein [Hamadaea tsunoensis]|uniref:hypothetical protein n=1 Tax=Hamadaea tsunoensis TaxID=53368 RepID=UPI0003FF9FDA|nr:hypothetical protein [Hamadaea tsunoensis]
MILRKHTPVLLLCAVLGAVSACGPETSSTGAGAGSSTGSSTGAGSGASTAASPQAGGGTAAGRDDCLIGTWKLDVEDMARQIAAKIPNGATGTSTGTVTLTFGDKMTITYANAVMITSPMSTGISMTITDKFAGSAESADWKAEDGKISGTMPVNNVKTTITMKVGNKEQAAPTQPLGGALDLSKGVLNYTCSGSTATMSNSAVSWKLTKA